MQNERDPRSPVSTNNSVAGMRSRSPVSQRQLDIASSRALQQEIHINAEPHFPSADSGITRSSGLRPAKKRVHSIDDLRKFLESGAAKNYIGFILFLGESVRGVKLTDEVEISQPVQRILDFLTKLSTWIDEIPPHDQTMRYGNIAFREWHDRLEFSNHLIEGNAHPCCISQEISRECLCAF